MSNWQCEAAVALAIAMGGSALIGCTGDAKGLEANAPTDGKLDSFFLCC